MELSEAYDMTVALMAEHGLRPKWRLEWDRATTRRGQTRYRERVITISRYFVEMNTQERVRQTALHEIAHALVGTGHGHDAVWSARFVALGGHGKRTLAAQMPAKKWKGVCPNCNGELLRDRRRPQLACGACCKAHAGGKWDERFVVSWVANIV